VGELKYFNEYQDTGIYNRDRTYHSILLAKILIIFFCLIYILKKVEKLSSKFERSLIRHQNFVAITYFYLIAFFVIMLLGVNAIQKHAIHVILYNSLPNLYTVILMFLFSVSPKGTTVNLKGKDLGAKTQNR